MSELLNHSTFLSMACQLKFENITLIQLAFSYSKSKLTTSVVCRSCYYLIVNAVVVVI